MVKTLKSNVPEKPSLMPKRTLNIVREGPKIVHGIILSSLPTDVAPLEREVAA